MRLLRWVQPSPDVCAVCALASPNLQKLGTAVDMHSRLVVLILKGLNLPLQLSCRIWVVLKSHPSPDQ